MKKSSLSVTNVIVGMSGGVDSSVASYLLLKKGYSVSGLFMKNWDEDDGTNYCTAKEDYWDAKQVASKLNIKLHQVNFASEYWDRVFTNFISEMEAGRTPNPDILCNKEIKFRAFLDYAFLLGADKIATGHYAKLTCDKNPLRRPTDLRKDQTYFLWALSHDQLKNCLFPLCNMTKQEVRNVAREQRFLNAEKKDSTGICFIGERRFDEFLKRYIKPNPGVIETDEGVEIAKHNGLAFHTIGQRQGLGIGGYSGFSQKPWYVARKDLTRNVLTVVQGNDNPLLFSSKLIARQINWIGEKPKLPLRTSAKIRYQSSDSLCHIDKIESGLLIEFDHPQRAVTLGQSIVFYQNESCLGGGVIEELLD